MAAGATRGQFNWFTDDQDAEDARHFIAELDGDELDARHWAVVRAYALLRTRWEAVEEIASKLQRYTTVLGEEVSKICSAEAARRGARLKAAKLAKSGWTESEIQAGHRRLSKAEAWRKIAAKSPGGARHVKEWQQAAAEGKPKLERR